MTKPLIKRVSAQDIRMDVPLTATSQPTSFERRLIRLWQMRKRPSEICAFLGITLKQMSSELDRLHNKLDAAYPYEDIPNTRQYRDKREKELALEDVKWLYSLPITTTNTEKADFIGVKHESLTHVVRLLDLDLASKNQEQALNRNQLIIEDYKLMLKNNQKAGSISRLATKYGVSRKTIDNVLGDLKQTQHKNKSVPPTDPAITKKREEVFREWNDRISSANSKRSLAIELAAKYGYKSEASVYKLVKELTPQ